MGICWYCHWGWSKPVAEIYKRALAEAGEEAMHYGPAHIVWDDENFERDHVQWCLDHFDEHRFDHSPDDLVAVRRSLQELLALPDEVLSPEPAEYDNEHPEQYPPKIETVQCSPRS